MSDDADGKKTLHRRVLAMMGSVRRGYSYYKQVLSLNYVGVSPYYENALTLGPVDEEMHTWREMCMLIVCSIKSHGRFVVIRREKMGEFPKYIVIVEGDVHGVQASVVHLPASLAPEGSRPGRNGGLFWSVLGVPYRRRRFGEVEEISLAYHHDQADLINTAPCGCTWPYSPAAEVVAALDRESGGKRQTRRLVESAFSKSMDAFMAVDNNPLRGCDDVMGIIRANLLTSTLLECLSPTQRACWDAGLIDEKHFFSD